MSKRLASFGGPSSPSPSPVKVPSPQKRASPALNESTFHRRLRAILLNIRLVTSTWNDLVLHDGLKAAKTLVDTRTELSNILNALPPNTLPRTRVVGPRVTIMEAKAEELDLILARLEKLFNRLSGFIEEIEQLLIEACNTKGLEWVSEPLWLTWSLDDFGTQIPTILHPYHQALYSNVFLVQTLKDHSLPFEKARQVIGEWAGQFHIVDHSWMACWEDLCALEVDQWEKN